MNDPDAWSGEPTLPFPAIPPVEGGGAVGAPTRGAHPSVPGYDILEEIGRGGMGIVYKARQCRLDRVVALKTVPAAFGASDQAIARFREEARAAARLQHPSIVRVHDWGEVDGQPFYAMEYLPGPNLDQLLKRNGGPLPPREAARLVASVARSVDHLHRQGIVHRDLKPSNILLDAQGGPCVTDLGLAKLMDDSGLRTASGAILGTPSYMAPEQAAGRSGEVGPRTDIYGLGAILYELLTGRPPFQGATWIDTQVRVLEAEPVSPRSINPAVPRDLEWIALRCLEKDPKRRHPDAAALADDLERFLRGEEVSLRRRSPWTSLRRWARRETALAARILPLAGFAILTQVNYLTADVPNWPLTRAIYLVFLCCAVASLAFRWLQPCAPRFTRFGWITTDLALVTLVFLVIDRWGDYYPQGIFSSAMMSMYALMICTVGLWLRPALVWYATALSEAAYLGLYWHARLIGKDVAEGDNLNVVMLMLGVVGAVTAYQVRRALTAGAIPPGSEGPPARRGRG